MPFMIIRRAIARAMPPRSSYAAAAPRFRQLVAGFVILRFRCVISATLHYATHFEALCLDDKPVFKIKAVADGMIFSSRCHIYAAFGGVFVYRCRFSSGYHFSRTLDCIAILSDIFEFRLSRCSFHEMMLRFQCSHHSPFRARMTFQLPPADYFTLMPDDYLCDMAALFGCFSLPHILRSFRTARLHYATAGRFSRPVC